MKNPARSFHGKRLNDDGSVTTVGAAISKPKPEKGEQDWSCVVHCPFLFASDKKIIGADAEQALELAETFVRSLLEHHDVAI